jgi:hypothetical protein
MKRTHIRVLLPLLVVGLVVAALPGQHVLQATPERVVPSPPVVPNLDAQLRSFAPQDLVSSLKNPSELQVQALPADLGKTRAYDYIVVSYVAPLVGGDLLVLRNVGGRLELAGTVHAGDDPGLDNGSHLKLVYVDKSGVPAVEIDTPSGDGMNIITTLFRWTGTQLVSLLPRDVVLTNAYFADPQGTGLPEIINPQQCLPSGECNGYWEVYEMKAGEYALAGTSTVDPSGLTPPP